MNQRTADNEIKAIVRFMIFAFAVGVLVTAVLAYFVPFDVDLHAVYADSEGEFYLTDPVGNEQRFTDDVDEIDLPAGGMVRLEAGSSARVEVIADSDAFAYLMSPVIWKLAVARRNATAYEHILKQEAGDYQVVIEQMEGSVVYDFSKADPSLQDMRLILRFPDGEIVPQTVCFQATAVTEQAASSVVEIPCWGEVRAVPQPTLPPLP